MTKAKFGWVFVVGLALVGCKDEHKVSEPVHDVPGPDGVLGVCCPVSDFEGCGPEDKRYPAGGWAKDAALCTDTVGGSMGAAFLQTKDQWGCTIYKAGEDCGLVVSCPANDACPDGKEGDGCQYYDELCPDGGEGGYGYVCQAGEWIEEEHPGCPDIDGGTDDGGTD